MEINLKVIKFLANLFKQTKCSHEFNLNELQLTNIPEPVKPNNNSYRDWVDYHSSYYDHPFNTNRVLWPCRKCGKIFYAHCGLDILKHGQMFIIDN